jgi:hypothetical protein
VGKGVQDVIRDPTRVTDFHDKRILLETRLKLPGVIPILRVVLEGPRKLNENGAQSLRFYDGINPGFEIVLVFGVRLSFMREGVEELRRKPKISIVGDAPTHFRVVAGCDAP